MGICDHMESPEDNNLKPAAVDRQPRLFLDSELDQRMDEESVNSAMVPKPRHTADRVLRDRPEDYRLAVELIGQGQLSQIEIARLCKMSEHTLMAIRAANARPIAEARAKMIDKLIRSGELCLDAVTEDLLDPAKRDKTGLRDKVIAFGVLNDHALKMTGQPTEIVGKLEARADHGDLKRYAASMKAAAGQGSTPAPWEMVSGPGNVPGKRTAGPGGSAAPAASDPEDVEEVPE